MSTLIAICVVVFGYALVAIVGGVRTTQNLKIYRPLAAALAAQEGGPWTSAYIVLHQTRAVMGYSSTLGVVRILTAGQTGFMDIVPSTIENVDVYKDEVTNDGSVTSYENVVVILTLSGAAPTTLKLGFGSNLENAEVWAGRLKGLIHEAGVVPVSDQLGQLYTLFQIGALTSEEWEQAKAHFLGRPESDMDKIAESLRQLQSLTASGVLSQSEFNMKKWDLLSKS